jgi:hypothetical protein
MKKIISLTETELTKLISLVVEQTLKKDKWGRDQYVDGKPNLWYGFEDKTKKWVQGPCTGLITNLLGIDNSDPCRKKLGLKTRSQMTSKEESSTYQPKTSKETPWPIQVNYYEPMDKKFPTGHIECRSIREPQYQMNANPIEMKYADILLGGKETKNFWNMPMTGKKIPDKPKAAKTVYVYLTDTEYLKFKKTTPALNLKLGYKAGKLAQSVKSSEQAIQNYNVLTQNCADGVAKALGAQVEKWTTTEKVLVGGLAIISPILSLAGAAINEFFDITLPVDVFNKIQKVYKGRITYSVK